MDALLPGQRLEGSTSDPTFGVFLRDLSIGGVFVMTSLDTKSRKLRRDATVCKIEVVDAAATVHENDEPRHIPTAVDFSLVGLHRCRILVGQQRQADDESKQLQARVGRWRRVYDPDGEESRLGWGMETFLEVPEDVGQGKSKPADSSSTNADHSSDNNDNKLSSEEWTPLPIQVTGLEDSDEQDEETLELAKKLPALLEQWQDLASREQTYQNTKVVATARIRKGQPGLFVDPGALLRNVRAELNGSAASSSSLLPANPTDLALFAAALINPLPPLGGTSLV